MSETISAAGNGGGHTTEPTPGPARTAARPWTQIALGIAAGLIASAGITAVTAAGFALSFDAIRTVGRAAHINGHLDWMLPVAIDGAMAVASVTAIVMQRMGRTPIYPWIVVLANVFISVGCNALHAYQGGGEKPLPGEWAMAVSAIPALNLALSLHLAIELVMAVVKRAEQPAAAKVGFAQFAPTVIHGGTRPQSPMPSQPVRNGRDGPAAAVLAPATQPGSLNGSQPEKPAPAQPETGPAKPAATITEQAPAKPVEKAAAKVERPVRRPVAPYTDDPNSSVRALAKAYARKPAGTNAELAKLARVSEGTANRYLPKIRQAAIDSENADADEERAQGGLTLTPFSVPREPVLAGVNGHLPHTPGDN